MSTLFLKKKFVTQKGFSLIELLVAVALFTVVMTVSVGTFLAIIDANRKSQSMKSVINNLNFSLDSMTRTIRTGRDYYCSNSLPSTLPAPAVSSANNAKNDCANGAVGIIVTDDRGRRVGYRFGECPNPEGGGSYPCIQRNIRTSGSPGGWIALTAPEVRIEDMRFYVTGSSRADTYQPVATISIMGEVETVNNVKLNDSEFSVQTTVTQRILDEN